jgi:hypothetical protein
MRTILDVPADGEVPLAILRQAVREGLRRGLIRRSEITEARKHLTDRKQLRTFFQKGAARGVQHWNYCASVSFKHACHV